MEDIYYIKYCNVCNITKYKNAGYVEEKGIYCGYTSKYDGFYLFYINESIPPMLKIGDNVCDKCIDNFLETNLIYIDKNYIGKNCL